MVVCTRPQKRLRLKGVQVKVRCWRSGRSFLCLSHILNCG
nr:MAG TPA: hypothetical protein [Caudoviricetes sp.]